MGRRERGRVPLPDVPEGELGHAQERVGSVLSSPWIHTVLTGFGLSCRRRGHCREYPRHGEGREGARTSRKGHTHQRRERHAHRRGEKACVVDIPGVGRSVAV